MNLTSRNLHIEEGQIVLLIIDPQVDFHVKGGLQVDDGSLPVKGSYENAKNTQTFITRYNEIIQEIFVTLDSHHKKHIAHKSFWSTERNDTDNKGTNPTDFTTITYDDLKGDKNASTSRAPKWYPKDASLENYVLEYTSKLEKEKNCFKLMIWPDHCLIGSEGHAVHHLIQEAIRQWDISHFEKSVKHIYKGMNCLTEMYSAIKAEVEIPNDENTTKNEDLLIQFRYCKKLIVCGQALSHCVKFTVEDIWDDWEKCKKDFSSMIILRDCTSPVPGHEQAGDDFIYKAKQRGVNVLKSTDTDALDRLLDYKNVIKHI